MALGGTGDGGGRVERRACGHAEHRRRRERFEAGVKRARDARWAGGLVVRPRTVMAWRAELAAGGDRRGRVCRRAELGERRQQQNELEHGGNHGGCGVAPAGPAWPAQPSQHGRNVLREPVRRQRRNPRRGANRLRIFRRQQIGESGLSGLQHLAEVRPAESALAAAAGLPNHVRERPAARARQRQQIGKRHPLADAAGNQHGWRHRRKLHAHD